MLIKLIVAIISYTCVRLLCCIPDKYFIIHHLYLSKIEENKKNQQNIKHFKEKEN